MLSLIRHQEIFNPSQNDQGVTIIGAGAVGSRVFSTLVELGLHNITVYDPDIVESHNLANQLFFHNDIGKHKVTGLCDWAQRKLGNTELPFKFKAELVTPEIAHNELRGTIFLLVDSLETRRQLAKAIHGNLNVPRVIDVRMAATHGNIITFSPHSQLQAYLGRTLGSDEDAEVSACGSPFSVAPTAALLANLAVWQFIHVKTNPYAHDPVVNVHFQPFVVSTKELQ